MKIEVGLEGGSKSLANLFLRSIIHGLKLATLNAKYFKPLENIGRKKYQTSVTIQVILEGIIN